MNQPAETHLDQARRQEQDGQFGAALDGYLSLIARHPGHAEANQALFALCRLKPAQDALITHLKVRLSKSPKDVVGHSLLVYLLEQREDWAAALPHMDVLYASGGVNAGFYINYLKALRANQKVQKALKIADEAIQVFPTQVELYALRGFLRQMVQDWDGSLADLTRANEIASHDSQHPYDLGLLKMLMSNMRDGFTEYEYRYRVQNRSAPAIPGKTRWHGESLAGKTLLLIAEEGIGDIVMFASVIPWLIEQASAVILAVEARLIPLFTRSFPGVTIIELVPELPQIPRLQSIDYFIPMGGALEYVLPHFRPGEHASFLKADPAQVDALRSRYREIAKARGRQDPFLVGISWHTTNNANDFMRNIPLDRLAFLADIPNVQCVSLQYGDHREAIAKLNRHKDPNRLYADPDIDHKKHIDALAAQTSAMDLVVSIQNATVHFAGALGVPCLLMLCAASNFRWGLQTKGNCWYQSVEILRQPVIHDWVPVLNDVKKRVTEAAAKGSAVPG